MAEAFTPEESGQLVSAFEKLGVKPTAATPEELEEWMLAHLKSKGKIQEEDSDEDDSDEDDPEERDKEKPAPTDKTASVSVQQQPPRLATFSGGKDAKGSDTTFELWHYEVKCLMQDKVYPRKLVLHAVRKSLRGEAGEVAMLVGEKATLEQILGKLEGIYGIVEPGENILSEFYAAYQGRDETVSTWGCRLESYLTVRSIRVW